MKSRKVVIFLHMWQIDVMLAGIADGIVVGYIIGKIVDCIGCGYVE